MSVTSDNTANAMAITMVAAKMMRSKPRRVWYAPLSEPPPKAPERPDVRSCNKIRMMRTSERMTWEREM